MRHLIITSIVLILVFSQFQAFGQIKNIESQRIITDTTGWSGDMGVSISAAKNTVSFFSFNGDGHLQHQTSKDLYLALIDYNLVNAGGEEFSNSGFLHFRYNRKISKLVRWELFTQGQFNDLTKIKSRYLYGTGIRFKLSDLERAKFYYGLSMMYESETLTDVTKKNNDGRWSSYFTFTLQPEQTVNLSNTTYLQPKMNRFRDLRLTNDTKLSFKISNHLNFSTNFHYLYDAFPPDGVPKSSYEISNGLTYGF